MVQQIKRIVIATIVCFALMAVNANLVQATEADDMMIKRLTQIRNLLKKKPTLEAYAEACLYHGHIEELHWSWSNGSVLTVPAGTRLAISDVSLSYTGDDEWAGVVLTGRDSADRVVFRNPLIFVESKKTLHIPFSKVRLLDEGGYVEVGFMSGGPSGTVLVSIHGRFKEL